MFEQVKRDYSRAHAIADIVIYTLLVLACATCAALGSVVYIVALARVK